MDVYVGFDSAWTDNPKAPGAICAIGHDGDRATQFHAPKMVSFNQAFSFITAVRSVHRNTLIALDQPTVVSNETGMRPVERVAASLISWMGGGVQPSNRGRLGMFCDASPIWQFLADLAAVQDPEGSRVAASGLYLIEVFPALALASLHAPFCGRLTGPRYNPDRERTFRASDWIEVARAAASEARTLGCHELASWCEHSREIASPKKSDQDKLDAALCTLIALRWRLRPRGESLLIGDTDSGYMVLPVIHAVRDRLAAAAKKYSVSVDGARP